MDVLICKEIRVFRKTHHQRVNTRSSVRRYKHLKTIFAFGLAVNRQVNLTNFFFAPSNPSELWLIVMECLYLTCLSLSQRLSMNALSSVFEVVRPDGLTLPSSCLLSEDLNATQAPWAASSSNCSWVMQCVTSLLQIAQCLTLGFSVRVRSAQVFGHSNSTVQFRIGIFNSRLRSLIASMDAYISLMSASLRADSKKVSKVLINGSIALVDDACG